MYAQVVENVREGRRGVGGSRDGAFVDGWVDAG
jgi:hypothetical protein